jgi:hypothetical protein
LSKFQHLSSSSLVIRHIEEMVLSFMSQSSRQGSKQSAESSASSESSATTGIKLHLVDRTKAHVEGFASLNP